MTRILAHSLLGLVFFAAACDTGDPPDSSSGSVGQETTVVPVVIDGNPDCADLGYPFGFKIDPPSSGTYVINDFGDTVTFTTDGVYWDWSSTMSMDAVLSKGGPNSNAYYYDPEAFADTGLASPYNDGSGGPYGLSHVEFCYDYEVRVSKTANPSFTRSYDWAIDKSADATELLLSAGQIFTVNYQVLVSLLGFVDSDWAVAGAISITNPAPMAATITGVTDVMTGDIAAAVDCGVSFPFELAASAVLVCSYSSALPDASSRTNTATVTTTGDVGGGEATAAVNFASATMNEVDECVDVTDDRFGALGTVCAGAAPVTFSYSMDLGPYECGTYEYANVASFVANDTAATGSDSWLVAIEVACEEGCTLTPGYWKTHSSYGPAPYDDNWANLADGADTAFFLSGQSWYQVLWTPPQGNSYYILAHAYAAAALNELNGADTGDVAGAMASAATLLSTYTPTYMAKAPRALRAQFIALAGELDAYNNGLTGPGHCDER